MKTMNDLYGDGSDHVVCEDCGECKVCGDCEKFGCRWVVHVIGPDDIAVFDNELDALRAVNRVNTMLAAQSIKKPYDPIIIARAFQDKEGKYKDIEVTNELKF